jgi:hypothetical protein
MDVTANLVGTVLHVSTHLTSYQVQYEHVCVLLQHTLV